MDLCDPKWPLIEKSICEDLWHTHTQKQGGQRGTWLCQLFVSQIQVGGDFQRAKGQNGKWQNKRVLFSPSSCSFMCCPAEEQWSALAFCWAGWHNSSHKHTADLSTLFLSLCNLMNDTPVSIIAPPLSLLLSLWLFPTHTHAHTEPPQKPHLARCLHSSRVALYLS